MSSAPYRHADIKLPSRFRMSLSSLYHRVILPAKFLIFLAVVLLFGELGVWSKCRFDIDTWSKALSDKQMRQESQNEHLDKREETLLAREMKVASEINGAMPLPILLKGEYLRDVPANFHGLQMGPVSTDVVPIACYIERKSQTEVNLTCVRYVAPIPPLPPIAEQPTTQR